MQDHAATNVVIEVETVAVVETNQAVASAPRLDEAIQVAMDKEIVGAIVEAIVEEDHCDLRRAVD